MNIKKFKIGDINIKFKYPTQQFDRDGHQATFYLNNFTVNFEISDTEYNSNIPDPIKSLKTYIDEKYGDLENCFYKIGIKYLEERISENNFKDETVSLLKHLF